jgi:predicted nucleic acid-binding protein
LRFWDASALVPLLTAQAFSDAADALLSVDDDIAVWWATQVECESALARIERRSPRLESELIVARRLLTTLAANWSEIEASDRLRLDAIRLLRVHPLRAADALQLAAALAWADDWNGEKAFVCLDRRLSEAAAREGFSILP